MIVYSDPQCTVPLQLALDRLRCRASALDAFCLNDVRTLLIESGKLEQAVWDHWPVDEQNPPPLRHLIVRFTDSVAELFHQMWIGANPQDISATRDKTKHLLSHLLSAAENPLLTVKTPEGFAFYGLFPEQYCAAAEAWRARHIATTDAKILVVGIRSIGTTLSAVVKAALVAFGHIVRRITVRPAGHPFNRVVQLHIAKSTMPACALIVDEGPGISGSSMAAAARALDHLGVTDISFLPGHCGEPGSSATPEIRRYWESIPRYAIPLEKIRWNGFSLAQSLPSTGIKINGTPGNLGPMEDLSAGKWRRFNFLKPADWPAVAAQFERLKFCQRNARGTSLLWKFAGLGCATDSGKALAEVSFARLSEVAAKGFGPQPLGTFGGFVALPWLNGRSMTRADLSTSVVNRMARYLARTARQPLSNEAQDHSIDRIAEMLFANTRAMFGDTLAERTRLSIDPARRGQLPYSYCDGHLAPYEWIVTNPGAIFKTDCEGHDADHTIVGPQSLLWDIAAVFVEWNLCAHVGNSFLHDLEEHGIKTTIEALHFYQMAYAAFRIGLASTGVSQTSDAAERRRLKTAIEFYSGKLKTLLRAIPKRRAINLNIGFAHSIQ